MQRRIMGIETEYGVTCVTRGQRRLTPDEVARYMFRKVVAWGRSSNVFLRNGARLYLDVGSHPEYATAECDSVHDLVVQDRAGELIIEGLVQDAQRRLTEDGVEGDIYVFKNNTDSAGNSYGCHENYLFARAGDLQALQDVFVPFLISRQLIAGAGKVTTSVRGAGFAISQRADHIWESMSSATTRSRPIINTRDEPHADAELYRRLHVIVGDSNMSEATTRLKVGSAHLVLQMIEEDVAIRDLTLENPLRAIRTLSTDVTGRATVKLANGKEISALDMQHEYLTRATAFADDRGLTDDADTRAVLDLWERTLAAVEAERLDDVAAEIDWIAKYRLIERYRERHGLELGDARVAQLDLAYHDINRSRGLHHLLLRRGQMKRITTDDEVTLAQDRPPQTTRARLRGDFIRAAQEHGRDFTVDWVHVKLNDHAQRTVLCKDPFASVDARVARLIEAIESSPTPSVAPPA